MEKFNQYFSKTILDRGKSYYNRKRVMNLKRSDTEITADVSGSDLYSVKITLKNGTILHMHCNCPFARGGNNCKHMAAVLYAETAEADKPKVHSESMKRDELHELQELLRQDEKEKPEEKKLPQDQYSYFDLIKIRSSLDATAGLRKKAQELNEQQVMKLQKIRTGYFTNQETISAVAEGDFVWNRNICRVSIKFKQDKILEKQCNCPECGGNYNWYYINSKACVHIIALWQLTEKYLSNHKIGDATDRFGAEILGGFSIQRIKERMQESESITSRLTLIPKLKEKEGHLQLSFRVGDGKLFVIKSLSEFVKKVKTAENMKFGSKTILNMARKNFEEQSRKYVDYIIRNAEDEAEYAKRFDEDYRYFEQEHKIGAYFELFGRRLDEFFEMMKDGAVEYEKVTWQEKNKEMIRFREKDPKASMDIYPSYQGKKNTFQGVGVMMELPEMHKGLFGGYYVQDHYLNRASREFVEAMEPFDSINEEDGIVFQIGRSSLQDFYYTVLPKIRDYVDIKESESDVIDQYLLPEVKFIFYLDAPGKNVVCKIMASYGGHMVDALESMSHIAPDGPVKKGGTEEFRQIDAEMETLIAVQSWLPYVDSEEMILHCDKNEELIYQLLESGLSALMGMGEVQTTNQFRSLTLRQRTRISVGVSVANGLMNLDISSEDVDKEELLDILKSYRQKKKYHRLQNGDFINIEEEEFEVLSELMTSLHMTPKEFVKGKMAIPTYRALYLDKMLEENENLYVERDKNFRCLLKDFKAVSEADYEVPLSLKKVLRTYQKTGYKWLRMIEHYGFGGILADDMGLGKTIQVIAVLLAAKEEGRAGTSLIVCPASLVYNWKEELDRFAPSLEVGILAGTQPERAEKIAVYTKYDVLVTSYDLLKRDIDLYEGSVFDYQIIDEAQYIKNHSTAGAKAVKIVNSRIKYALTGTPIENRLSELWSIFDYLMPGFLYGYETFKKDLETPIVKSEDQNAARRLKKMVGPFILRRLKQDVLKDLPAKLEETRYAKFDTVQQQLYDAQVLHMRQKFVSQNTEEFQKNKIQMLAELTRLRQICCDPSLCFENYKGESAKRQACIDMIESALDGGHKILLFSQFTSMLELIQKDLKEKGISYYVITGATPKEKRLQMVKAFNTDETQVFLISLKAGGTGLNLTGADIVIHYDPWWNVAAQNQATDRAHRIGQTRAVTVYKLIIKHSIEEKIQKLQETKQGLADQIIGGETSQLSGMTKEDLLELLN